MKRTINFLVHVATNTAFRSVEVRRVAPEPSGAVLVLANHGGGLADILTVIVGCTRFPRFLARDIIWKFPVARTVMNSAGAIPVSRRQDHGGAADNTGLFGAAWTALADGDLLAIYPEGESVAEPRLARLRTGAARILLGAWARGTDVWIEPMGLHYYDMSVLRGRGLVQVGTPVRMSDLVDGLPEPLTDDNREAVRALTAMIAQRLSRVVAEYDDWQQRRDFESAAVVYLTGESGTNVDYADIATTAEAISRAPEHLRREVLVSLHAYTALLELLGVDEGEIPKVAMTRRLLAGRAAQILVLSPAAAYGAVVNGLPMVGLRAISLTGVHPATAASLKPAFALIAFPAMWSTIGWWGHQRAGVLGAVAMAATGPLSLAATVRVAEKAQLTFLVARAVRRARGPVVEQLVNARRTVKRSVDVALEAARG
jgi:1-acyl-sn-glycerol-3-phosphate acyltransferase